ncbi:glucosaminidase domain-containing protein [Levilactobacillus bambusae]|uniref:glucosaminidase domain-containing protein n=1 Tax=Levilactobacillus bambusae TaxID=2024736 RepID=UPI001CDA6127|nr:glucosaminidase domain-containing protein [Levilactobacillus bambusae]
MKHKRLVQICAALVFGFVGAGSFFNQTARADSEQEAFISKLSRPVQEVTQKDQLYGSVMMAQAILESSWGSSQLSKEANNYFGIKGDYKGQSVTMRTAEYDSDGNKYYVNAKFKKYPSAEASIKDNARILRGGTSWDNAYYSGAWKENAQSYTDAAATLANRYATNSEYGNNIGHVIRTYHLTKLDQKVTPAKQVDTEKTVTNKQPVKTTRPKTKPTKSTATKFMEAFGIVKAQASRIYTKMPDSTQHQGASKSAAAFINHRVTIHKQATTTTGTVWYEISDNGNTGWIKASDLYITKN